MKTTKKKSVSRPNKRPTKKAVLHKVVSQKKLEIESKLSHEEKLQVLTWLVEHKSTREIAKLCETQFGKPLDHTSIWRYKHSKKWGKVIRRLKERAEKELTKIAIANKTHRLRLLDKVSREGLTWTISGHSNDGQPIYSLDLRGVISAVKEARAEMEGEKAPGEVHNHFHLTTIVKKVAEQEKKRQQNLKKDTDISPTKSRQAVLEALDNEEDTEK